MGKTKDEIVDELFLVIQEKKAEIKEAEKPDWKTNCSFKFSEDTKSKNIRTVSNVVDLVNIASFLIGKETDYTKANKILETDIEFLWFGETFSDWISDLKTRINQIQITERKIELNNLEARLDKLVSKEKREQMELEEIEKLLNK